MKILLIEDEHKINASIKKGLEQEGYVADAAFDGEEGLDLALTQQYDCLVLDLMIPKIDGLEVCKQMREAKNHTPVLMLTAKGELDDRVRGLNTGADDYLIKPFAFVELVARIKALTRRPQTIESKILSSGNLSLDTSTLSVQIDNRQISLTRKEYSILEYLLRHKNAIISKDQLIENVWSYESEILPNTVEATVSSLRKKVPGKVQTVRGFGYKIS